MTVRRNRPTPIGDRFLIVLSNPPKRSLAHHNRAPLADRAVVATETRRYGSNVRNRAPSRRRSSSKALLLFLANARPPTKGAGAPLLCSSEGDFVEGSADEDGEVFV